MSRIPVFVLLAGAVFAVPLLHAEGTALQAVADGHAEHHHPAERLPLPPLPQTRWQPDAPLMAGMGEVRARMHALVEGQASDAAAVRAQAKAIRTAVAGMFAECTLAPEPDAALHAILIPLDMHAARLLENPDARGQVQEMHALVAAYPRYFDDPGWSGAQAD